MFDFSPLYRSVNFKEALRGLKAQDKLRKAALAVGILLALVPIIIAIPVTITGNMQLGGGGVLLFLFVTGLYVLFDIWRQSVDRVRVIRFATQNRLELVKDDIGRTYPGSFFSHGQVAIINALRTPRKPFFEFGNFRLLVIQGQPHYGYVRIKLPRRLPHMLLKSMRNPMPLPADLVKAQYLSLEGDFYKHFRLYVPRQYERDALYVFTPDIMALFIDTVGEFTCEIVDDELYLYAGRKIKMTDQGQIEAIVQTVAGLMGKFDRQIDYYADERVGDRAANVIAKPGQRLREKSIIPGIILSIIGVTGLIWLAVYLLQNWQGNNGLNRTFATIIIAILVGGVATVIGVILPKFKK